jgi:hypothetical protein
MATSDPFSGAADATPMTSDTSCESPQIVPIPSSFDLTEFPSEASDTVEPLPVPEAALPEPSPQAAEPAATPASTATAPEPPKNSPAMVPDAASILEFPLQLSDSVSTVDTNATDSEGHVRHDKEIARVTLADLLDRHESFGWREAVAVVHEICMRLKEGDPERPILLEPKNIEITANGGVYLLPARSGGGPLVAQLGRLLRLMLMGKAAPPELRLLLSQVTFEVPILASVEDVARALRHFGGFEQGDAVRTAFDVAAQPASPGTLVRVQDLNRPAPTSRPILTPPAWRGRKTRDARKVFSMDGALVASILLAAAMIFGLVVTSLFNATSQATQTAALVGTHEPATAPLAPSSEPKEVAATSGPSNHASSTGARSRVPSSSLPNARPGGPPPLRPGRVESYVLSNEVAGHSTSPSRAGGSAPAAASPRETERRAAALIAEGQTQEASMVFDALVIANPLYEPKPQDLTPEALAAFRASRRLLLPVIAMRDYDRAKNALTAGDSDRALVLGNQASAILDRIDSEPTPNLRRGVQDLLNKATAIQLSTQDIIYSLPEGGIVPPYPLSRQFPATTPAGVPANRVGTLDLIVGRLGEVEFVKLYTPLNRYHERMIVSAVKAWRYRPATKDGRPVKYRLRVTINLPESGDGISRPWNQNHD